MLDTFTSASAEALAAVREEMDVRRTSEVFLLFPMGSQFDHLIAQKMARQGVYCLAADPASVTAADVELLEPKGIILSGGPAAVATEPPPFDSRIFDLGIPVLGICLGFQMWAKHLGAEVVSDQKEFGPHWVSFVHPSLLFEGIHRADMPVLQSHGDRIIESNRMIPLARSADQILAAAAHNHLYGVQFHPECSETQYGDHIFENFIFKICGARDRFPAENIAGRKINRLREQIGKNSKVLLALSGGSDSSTVAYLLKHAVGDKRRLMGVYIKGVDRPDDEAFVLKYFGNQDWITLNIVDATNRFLEALAGKTSMKEKRESVRGVYKPVLEEAAAGFGADFIAQGTLYTDISESGGGYASGARKAVIKVHHNTNLDFSLQELAPLDDCVKDGGRSIGRAVGVPEELLIRHPFPGPGLVVRIEGEITREKLAMARELDRIYIEELRSMGLYELVWLAGVNVTASEHSCTKGDDAGAGPLVLYFAVESVNGFTARPAHLPGELHERIVRRFVDEVPGIGATGYKTSGKPPSTIEMG